MPLTYGLKCLHKELACLLSCVLEEMQGDVIAADARVYAAVESGLLPALLQQLPAAVFYAVQSARQVKQRLGHVRGDSSRPVTLMAILLAEVLPSEQKYLAAI